MTSPKDSYLGLLVGMLTVVSTVPGGYFRQRVRTAMACLAVAAKWPVRGQLEEMQIFRIT